MAKVVMSCVEVGTVRLRPYQAEQAAAAFSGRILKPVVVDAVGGELEKSQVPEVGTTGPARTGPGPARKTQSEHSRLTDTIHGHRV